MEKSKLTLNSTLNTQTPLITGPSTFQFNEAFYLFFAPYFLAGIVFILLLGITMFLITRRCLYSHPVAIERFHSFAKISNFVYFLNPFQLQDLRVDMNNTRDKNKYLVVSFMLLLNTIFSFIVLIIFCVSVTENKGNMNVKVEHSVQPNSLIQ